MRGGGIASQWRRQAISSVGRDPGHRGASYDGAVMGA